MIRRRNQSIWLTIVLPCVLFALLIAAIAWGLTRNARAEKYENATKSMYSRSYNELVNELNELEVTMSKLQIAGTKSQFILLLDDVWNSCGICTGLMSQIPSSHADSYEMNQFIIRVGDYAKSLETGIIHGEMLSGDDVKQLSELRNTCAQLATRVTEHYNNGDYPDDILGADSYFVNSDSFKSEDSRQKYPTLIYDGPFSEGAEKREPKGLNDDEVSRTTAYNKALEYIGTTAGLEFASDSNGDIPAYDFTGRLNDGREFDISITKKGGKLLWYMSSATSDIKDKPDKETLKAYKTSALNYLSDHDYPHMAATYAQYYDGIVLINFAAKLGNVVLYNDLVKVWVDRATGEVVGVDARNYLFSHVSRSIKPTKITLDDAKELVSDNLEIKSTGLALIPVTPENEVLCYEIKGEFAGQSYIVYINAWTGDEQQIFRIIDTEQGALVI